MKWRRNQQQQQQQQQQQHQKQEEKKKKQTSSSSTFSFSSVLPFSWFSKLAKPKRSPVAAAREPVVFTPPPSPRPPDPNPNPRSASAHLPFSPAVLDRFPPTVPDVAPRRLSLGDDDGGPRARVAPAKARHRPARHHSVGDLDLTLGHLIPFSRRPTRRWGESDTGSDASGCDLGLRRRRPPRPRRRRSARAAAGYSPDQRGDADGRDGLPRRSFSGKIRHRARAKVRVRSPRPAAAKAEVEKMKAAARRRRAEMEGKGEGARRGLESFAVVKCSCDPQRDFRESMVEMIWQKGIGRPEELESLLACYLSLNSDEHHDVIVKVFRQVWFELNPERLGPECNRRR